MSASELSNYLNKLPYNKESYTLMKDESLDSVAKKLGISKDELMSFNNLESSRSVKEGDTIIYWRIVFPD